MSSATVRVSRFKRSPDLVCEAGKLTDPSMRNVQTVLFALALVAKLTLAPRLLAGTRLAKSTLAAFGRQALGMVWDFCEVNRSPVQPVDGRVSFQWIAKVCESQAAMRP